jgi:Putative Actinobacterial Holin-X, holin superfamily III
VTTSFDGTPNNDEVREQESRRSVGELLSAVSQDVTDLLRQEIALAKAEARQSASSAGKGVGMFAGAGVAGHMVLLFLSIALWWGLGNWMGNAWSALVVAVVWLVIAAVLGVLGRSELKSVSGVPQTTETIKKIPDAAKGNEETV